MYMPSQVVASPSQLGLARRTLLHQLLSFAVIGGAGFLLDVGVFNLLSLTVFSAHVVSGGPLYAKSTSTVVAIAANWIGNRWLTFRESKRSEAVREAIEFGMVSLAGGAIALLCLWISHYALGLHSSVADNISANVVGLLLGSTFRFVVYRNWVFNANRTASVAPSPPGG
ncbi:putative flippase GtrA [Microterricola gilva]|uniref:Putative flippase GtrA n=1 Tax=Microterricola gilva TaxID=393267 RepID=A0A4Q8AR72_9MICO|nr:GtrA family protein [Microterricola gilva]RZU66721.1 putative flippase GtrA [Microterricola gilva]